MDHKQAVEIVKDFFIKSKDKDTFPLTKNFMEAREFLQKISPFEINEIFQEVNHKNPETGKK